MKIKIADNSGFSKDEWMKVDQNKEYTFDEAIKLLASLKAVIYEYDEETKTITINHVYDW